MCVSINITSGKSRQSSSATLGSISWIGKPLQKKEPNLLQNLPISPNLDRLPLIPGIVEVLNFLEADIPPVKAVSMNPGNIFLGFLYFRFWPCMWFDKETMKENKQRRRFTDISSRDGKLHRGPSQTDREEEATKPKCERRHKFNRSETINCTIKGFSSFREGFRTT